MLVQFRFKNFASFREEVCFDMRAVKAYKEHPYNLCSITPNEDLLKVAAIYGANASGKSNFVKAYSFFSSIVRNSFSNAEDKKTMLAKYYNPFLLSDDNQDLDTEFSTVYVKDNYQYEYGFVYNDNEIVYEWLYRKALAGKRKTKIFERDHQSISLGNKVEESLEKYKEEIEKDVLVLSFFNRLKLKNTAFKLAYNSIISIPVFGAYANVKMTDLIEFWFDRMDNEGKKALLDFFDAVDIRITDFVVEKRKEGMNVRFFHPGADGKLYGLPLGLESDGTKKIIGLYMLARNTLITEGTLVVDELNMQLHPLLARYIVNMFHASKGRGQLIYTTHDTTLLDKSYFRRDQIWFVEKSEHCESTMYSLADYSIRKDASYEKEYLGGAYGGIPILKDTNDNNC